jgi:hypothetical protein
MNDLLKSQRGPLKRLRSRLAQGARFGRIEPDAYWAHSYFTDGVRLYRFVGWVSRSVNQMLAVLEDCRSFEVLLVAADDLVRTRLRPIALPA